MDIEQKIMKTVHHYMRIIWTCTLHTIKKINKLHECFDFNLYALVDMAHKIFIYTSEFPNIIFHLQLCNVDFEFHN